MDLHLYNIVRHDTTRHDSGVVFGVASDMFHGVPIGNGVHKVEVQGVMLP
jgi:hypothetical protein